MASAAQSLGSLAICSRCLKSQSSIKLPLRTFSTASLTAAPAASAATTPSSQPANPPPLIPTDKLDPNTVATVSEENRLIKHRGQYPIGSRRRRAVLSSIKNAIPFEQLPYQCFQEARKVIAADREEKLQAIEKMRAKIAHLEARDPEQAGGESHKNHRLNSMRKHLEYLKIQADINDPLVKKRFEDGMGDMNKPIYRYLADKKWRSMKRKVLMQRITQMHVVPDALPGIDPTLDVDLLWRRRGFTPGDFVPCSLSANPPSLRIQKFDKGEAMLTVVAVDSDVPDVESDGFRARCHGVWTGIRISPNEPNVGKLGGTNAKFETVVPWSPPYAQKGSPYHRISLFVFEHADRKPLSEEQIASVKKAAASSETASAEDATQIWLRGFVEMTGLKATGVTMFRTQWDETTREVMEKHGIEGADIEFRRKKPEKLPEKYRVKDGLRYRGWKK
ncbi:uncharacterized protein PV09_08166 [Verruconis gallopava]|uniref:Phosphatidylethanolamine-binding protein n=1 Tax=Verruconis gallopava TaxID=253628 RepID=A0A0D1XDG5_9PEZI|nr:uncharacterized protein PV09_08166 [Verruconis gallopava]KIW00276.1 hypothetical protein PV09_08166 [Verruconis gallopava]